MCWEHTLISTVYMGNRGKGWLGFSDVWSGRKPWWNWYLTLLVNFSEVQRAQLAKSTLLTSKPGPPGIIPDLLRSVQMLKREWGVESNGKLPHQFIPSKTATLIPEFALEDLPLGRTADLVPEFAVKDLPLDRTLMMMMMMIWVTNNLISSLDVTDCDGNAPLVPLQIRVNGSPLS